jgi:hypothetical protein
VINVRSSVSRCRRSKDLTQIAASKRFRGYRREEGKAERQAEQSGAIKAFAPLWESIRLTDNEDYRLDNVDEEFARVLRAFRGIRFTAAHIEEISAMLHVLDPETDYELYFNDKAGLFLSAAVETSPDRSFTIHTEALREPPNFLGCFNRKKVKVLGDAGAHVGFGMTEGTIQISGNAALVADNLKGGLISIEGDALDWVGNYMSGGVVAVKGCLRGAMHPEGEQVGQGLSGGQIIIVGGVRAEDIGQEMTGGKISIGGDVDANIGFGMSGGEIHIAGEISLDGTPTTDLAETIDGMKAGKIYHKGRLIVDK